MRQCKFRVMEDNVRTGTFRIVHLSEISAGNAPAIESIEEDGTHFKVAWIRDSDGKPEEYTSKETALRAVQDMCGEIDLSGYTQVDGDIPVEETCNGFRAL